MGHLVLCVHVAGIVLAAELVDVTLKVFLTHLVERALVGAFEHGPERLDAVRVHHTAYVLADAMLHGVEIVDVLEARVRSVVVRVEGSTEQDMIQYEIMQGFRGVS